MTTTAEKISFVLEQLEKRSKNKSEYAENILAFFGLGQEHRFSIFAYVHKEMDLPSYIESHIERDVKSADPEPLECWVWFKPDNPKAATHVHLNKSDASMHAKFMTNEGWTLYHMREVTPQDEQDRKDAALYRWLDFNYGDVIVKAISRFSSEKCLTGNIDKAMEGGDAK